MGVYGYNFEYLVCVGLQILSFRDFKSYISAERRVWKGLSCETFVAAGFFHRCYNCCLEHARSILGQRKLNLRAKVALGIHTALVKVIFRTGKLTCRVIEGIFFKTLEGRASNLFQGNLGTYVVASGHAAGKPAGMSLYVNLFPCLKDIGVGCIDLEPVGLYCFNM